MRSAVAATAMEASCTSWPDLDFRRTPHFCFLKGGRAVYEVVGAVPSLAADLQAGLAKLGLS